MLLHNPVIITPRLMAGVRVGKAYVSIKYDKVCGDNGRTRYRYYIDLPNGKEYTNNDAQSGCQGGNLQSGLESLLSFLSACGESLRYSGENGENSKLFPLYIAKWASQNSDELSMLSCELEETKGLIEE